MTSLLTLFSLIICMNLFANNPTGTSMSDAAPVTDLLADPKFKAFFDKFTEHFKNIANLSLPEQRKKDAEFCLSQNTCHESIHRVENVDIIGSEKQKIPLRIYIPKESVDLLVIMYFHMGGWVFGSIEESDAVCRRLANYLGHIVVSVGYRLAPEYPFPKPLEDCYDATVWMAKHASDFGGDSKKIVVCGESSGGNLAAALTLLARDRGGPALSAQILLYPCLNSEIDDHVFDRCPDRFFITKDLMKYFWQEYLQNPDAGKNPYASPEYASSHKSLPPAVIILGEYDPLRTEGEKYASHLRQNGVKVITKCIPQVIHGFLHIPLYEEKQKVEWTKEIGVLLSEISK